MKLKQDRKSPKESDARTLISWDTLKKKQGGKFGHLPSFGTRDFSVRLLKPST